MVLKEDIQFRKDLESLALQIKEKKSLISNEQETKQFLIIPFIQILGYDISNPGEVKLEFPADIEPKKGEKIDFALLKENKPIIFIEAKPVNVPVDNFEPQLRRYFNAYHETKFGVITNGEEYRFFSDTQNLNVMDNIPFLTVNFSNLKESDFKNLLKFKKENYDEKSLCNIAEDLHYITAITEKFKELLKKPSDEFIELLFKSAIRDQRLSPKLREKLPPLVKIAIQNSISEMTRQVIEDQQKEAQNIQQQKIPEIKQQKVAQVQPSEVKPVQTYVEKPIEISDEEMKAFELVKSILQKAGRDISGLRPKNTMSYFSINNRDTRGWFLRLFLKERMKSINVKIDTPNIESLTKEFEIKKYPNSGVTNIIINSIDDLKKLDKLIITCFDEVNK